jgi:hypothetical protein
MRPIRRTKASPLQLFVIASSLVAGCASVPPPQSQESQRLTEGAQSCVAWMRQVDQAVDDSGVRDASAHRIPGYPYLRVDRFSASFRGEASAGGAAFDAWAARLNRLDLAARGYELANLPATAVAKLGLADLRAVADRTAQCEALLLREDLSGAARREALLGQAIVPDDYADWMRATGLDAATRIPFAMGVEAWHKESAEMFRKAASGEGYAANLQRFHAAGDPVAVGQVRAILSRVVVDALGVPQLGVQDAETLFRAYAPDYEIETRGTQDRFGPLLWAGAVAPEVDTARPVVYRRLAYTRYGGRTLLQLAYTVWFPERPADRRFDILAGKLDGLVFRVTLDTDGRPLVYDTIHPCGCYHMFFPTALVKPLPAPNGRDEWALVPSTLPALDPGRKVAVRIASGSHYVVGVNPAGGSGGEAYGFADDDALRSVARPGGGSRSVFGPDGLVAGTERAERLLFWPRGIASPGTMRQWGRQPTAFIGRRHFDDADLIEKRFARAEAAGVVSTTAGRQGAR